MICSPSSSLGHTSFKRDSFTAKLLLDVVAVLLCLLTANGGIAAGLLGFDYRQRL
jgi:hypothetical protein